MEADLYPWIEAIIEHEREKAAVATCKELEKMIVELAESEMTVVAKCSNPNRSHDDDKGTMIKKGIEAAFSICKRMICAFHKTIEEGVCEFPYNKIKK